MDESQLEQLSHFADAIVWPWVMHMCCHLVGRCSCKPPPLPEEFVASALQHPACAWELHMFETVTTLCNPAPAVPDAGTTLAEKTIVAWANLLVQSWTEEVYKYAIGLGPQPDPLEVRHPKFKLRNVKSKAVREQAEAAWNLMHITWLRNSRGKPAKSLRAPKPSSSPNSSSSSSEEVQLLTNHVSGGNDVP